MPRRTPTLALCVIAKNEERFIADCLESAKPFVDEIVVVDTGSTDRTREIARECGARVEEFVWIDDFAAARNAAIEAATSDWILMLDADERLDPASGPLLRGLARQTPSHVHALAPVIENRPLSGERVLTSTVAVPRFFPRRAELRFVGAIHEVVTYIPDPRRTLRYPAPQIRLIHYGYDPEVYTERDKDARNLVLLEREVANGSDDPRMPFFLLQQHAIARRWPETVAAFPAFERVIPLLPHNFGVEGYQLYLNALLHLGDGVALERAEAEAVERNMLGVSSLETLSEHFADEGDLERAIAYRLRALEPGLPEGLDQVAGRGGWATRLSLAGLYDRAGDAASAFEQLEQAFSGLPADRRPDVSYHALEYALRNAAIDSAIRWAPRALQSAADTLEDQQKVLQLVVQLHAMRSDVELETPWSAIDRALAGDDLQVQYDLASELAPTSMAAMVRLLAVIERVREAEEHQAALVLLNRALDGPKLEVVYWLLIKTLTQLGRYQDAQLAVEALRGLQAQPQAA